MRCSLLLLSCLLASTAIASGPAEAVAAAHGDALRLAPQERLYTRYLSLYAIPQENREPFLRVLAFHLNSLSREADLTPPRLVTPDLVAVKWIDYGWDPAVWERLASVDPYFHQKVKLKDESVIHTVWPGGKQGEKFFKAGKYKEMVKAGTILDVSAPWLPAKDIAELREYTLSETPVLRADWFLFQSAIQTDRVAGYYDFLNLGKKEADFQKLIGANVEESRRVKREIAAALARSGVTLQNRGIVRFQSLTGGYWVTQDFKSSVARQNVLRLLDQDREPPQGDASEQYGVLPNGLFAFWLQNAKGERQDTAPDFIASDHQTSGNDRRIHAGKSCITCHVEGLRPIDDYVRKIYKGSVKLTSPDYEKYKRLKQLYLSDLDSWLKRDVGDYSGALFRLTAWKPNELARAYSRIWDGYAESDLLPPDIAREMGLDEKALLEALKGYATTTGEIDPILAGLLQTPPVPIRREHWEEMFGLAMTITKGLKP